jgi:hypothetical protein
MRYIEKNSHVGKKKVFENQRLVARKTYGLSRRQQRFKSGWGRQIWVSQRTPKYKNLGVVAFPGEIVIPTSTRIRGYPRGIQVFFRVSSCGMENYTRFLM